MTTANAEAKSDAQPALIPHRWYTVMRNLGLAFFALIAVTVLSFALLLPDLALAALVILPPAAVLAGVLSPVRSEAQLSRQQRRNGSLLGFFGCILLVVYGYWLFAWSGFAALRSSHRFHSAIAGADRIVIRDGGFDCCCTNVDTQAVLLVLTNQADIAEFNSLIKFRAPVMKCRCCGYPGVDWWKGEERLALTSVQHGHALRWDGFSGDVGFTRSSSRMVRKWFKTHCGIEF